MRVDSCATVIVAMNYAEGLKQRPKLCARTIRERDGNRWQHTGNLLQPDEGSLDHVGPGARGDRNSWENLLWSAKGVNQHKTDRLPHAADLKLLTVRRTPNELPVMVRLCKAHGVAEWKPFLNE